LKGAAQIRSPLIFLNRIRIYSLPDLFLCARIRRMIKTFVLPTLLALGFAFWLVGQTEADYSGWMKQVGATKGKMTKAIAAKQNAEAAADATTLAGLFKQVGAFWSSRNVSDAVEIAHKAEMASNDLAAAANSGDDAKMQASLQTLNGACGQCHSAHREGSPGSFKIKQ
jgi:hypothetical protein